MTLVISGDIRDKMHQMAVFHEKIRVISVPFSALEYNCITGVSTTNPQNPDTSLSIYSWYIRVGRTAHVRPASIRPSSMQAKI